MAAILRSKWRNLFALSYGKPLVVVRVSLHFSVPHTEIAPLRHEQEMTCKGKWLQAAIVFSLQVNVHNTETPAPFPSQMKTDPFRS